MQYFRIFKQGCQTARMQGERNETNFLENLWNNNSYEETNSMEQSPS